MYIQSNERWNIIKKSWQILQGLLRQNLDSLALREIRVYIDSNKPNLMEHPFDRLL